jgi:hypothetical protein
MGLSFIGGDTWETYQTGMILVYFIMHHVTYKVRVMMFNSTQTVCLAFLSQGSYFWTIHIHNI